MPRELFFDNFQQMIDDIERLRHGCTQEGNWNLAQVCWHNQQVAARWLESPANDTPDTDLQKKMKPLFPGVLKSRMLPGRLDAPAHLVPPADAPASAIDNFISFLKERQAKGFPAVNHRFWGNISAEQAEQMVFIHSANHLRFLHPTNA